MFLPKFFIIQMKFLIHLNVTWIFLYPLCFTKHFALMSQKRPSPTIELKIPVLPDMELVATNAVEVVSRHMGLSEEKSAEIGMALIEATINAFEHGSPEHEVFIHFIMHDDSLTVKVIDKGQGFEQSKLELPDIDQKVKPGSHKRGWGVALIQELVDIVNFDTSSDGTTVTMVKHKNDQQ